MTGAPCPVGTRWGATVALSPFASVGVTERALIAANVLRDCSWDYAKDAHFSRYTLASLTTMADIEAFLDKLDKAAARTGWSGSCTKARAARASIARQASDPWNRKFWEGREAEGARSVLAGTRRICCGCHEAGSFARYGRGKIERRPRK